MTAPANANVNGNGNGTHHASSATDKHETDLKADRPHPAQNQQFSSYQSEILMGGVHGRKPIFTVEPLRWEEEARKLLGEEPASYVWSGAGALQTMAANRKAFDDWKIMPRMLRHTAQRDITCTLFGDKLKAPILMAPVGVQSIFHTQAEAAAASIGQELGIGWCMSTASTMSIEQLGQANKNGVRWYQLYWPTTKDNDITRSILTRAWDSGFTVLLVTLDTWQMAWRPTDLNNSYNPFLKGTGDQVGFSDPVFRSKFKASTGKEVEDDIEQAALAWVACAFSGATHEWSDLAFLRECWPGKIVLKGIQHVEDARKAVEYQMDGIVVSNHGGRQVDGAIGSLDCLPPIVDAVGDKLTILFDSGIRTGADAMKALALGAKAVLVGRQYIYGLALGGRDGVRHVMKCLLADFDLNMGLAGFKTLDELKPDTLQHITEIHEQMKQLRLRLRK